MKFATLACAATLFTAGTAALGQAPAVPATPAPPNPTEVALTEQPEEGFVYRRFPTGEHLYVSNRDPIGRSACNEGCSSAWPPVLAPAGAKPVGHWTIVVRDDGSRQWALKGRPVYSRFHDTPIDPSQRGEWRMLTQPVAVAIMQNGG